MDETSRMTAPNEQGDTANPRDHFGESLELREESSQPFVGMWNRLVSQTNWEKGAIILKWRGALIDEDAPATAYSDEAWSQLVGGVTSQHVGRLRRVHQRFADTYHEYEGLYWSHFQAALDWDDAEMWLEGAVQNRWSISQMRKQRWEAMGADPSLKPSESDVIVADVDEDFEPLRNQLSDANEGKVERSSSDASGPRLEGPDFGDEIEMARESGEFQSDGVELDASASANEEQTIRPFENLSELPEDLADAFDRYKLAIIRHRNNGWRDISLDDLLGSLDALKALARLPVENSTES